MHSVQYTNQMRCRLKSAISFNAKGVEVQLSLPRVPCVPFCYHFCQPHYLILYILYFQSVRTQKKRVAFVLSNLHLLEEGLVISVTCITITLGVFMVCKYDAVLRT
jgi:hypothetical protein